MTDLAKIMPESETQWRDVASQAHRERGFPGDEAAAKTHELVIHEIRNSACGGSSRLPHFCPRCEAKGNKVQLIFMGGSDQCGTCLWPKQRE